MKRRFVVAIVVAAAGLLLVLAGAPGRVRATDIATVHDEPHMEMTMPDPEKPGDAARAAAILAAARDVMAEYPTADAAERAGTIRTRRTRAKPGSDASIPRIRRR